MKPEMVRLGIDVGGTNTDAVLMRGRKIIGTHKSATTPDVMSGVIEAVAHLLSHSGLSAPAVSHVMIGTTQFINAFVQRRDLVPTAIVRAALPRGDGVPPLVAWPNELLGAIGHHAYQIQGGANFDGSTYAELDEAEINKVACEIARLDIGAVAISATYGPLRVDIEERVERIIASACPHVSITRSSSVGGIGLIDRENAAIINASLAPFARRVVDALGRAFDTLGIHAPIYISQNDGTLISTEEAARYPVFTCAAGPTNSIRGAAFLSGLRDAVVVDVGGTTTDVGYIAKGFPKETALANLIGGVRTNMRMPDILSVSLGGGTIVALGQVPEIGPYSVGHRLKDDAWVFGGSVLTTSDIAVAAGVAEMGDATRVAGLPRDQVATVMARMALIAEEAIDRIKTSAAAVPAILVGGGNILLPSSLRGVSEIIRPEHAAVANAVGAAIATVSGRVDRLYDTGKIGRDAAVAEASAEAIAVAVAAGADPASVEIVELIELPMTHVEANTTQIKVRAVGELAAAMPTLGRDAA
jgi:N-methylhydantoinase A/oxoprolinase/acetone carboxylase beta subunit